ncbi:hypothetical protein MFTT_18130 [Mycolicibacterium fortuitum subsp. fortuitum]|nr:hypothetical protein MFTT_18130 [Mycolicibacterium fortuitum subsp. fortuitum]
MLRRRRTTASSVALSVAGNRETGVVRAKAGPTSQVVAWTRQETYRGRTESGGSDIIHVAWES